MEESTNCKLIPCYNKNKEFIDNIIISNEDYDRVMEHKWCICVSKQINGEYKYARTTISGKSVRLSHFIFGKPKNGNVIDHINNNAIDNRIDNLQEVSRSQNSQNKKKIINEKSPSKYLGVTKHICNKWSVNCSGNYLGLYEDEKEAALVYDKGAFILFGKNASTNNLIKFEDIINLTLDDIKQKIQLKTLDSNNIEVPLYINFTKNKTYKIQRTYNKKKFSSIHSTLDEAKLQLEIYNKEIEDMKKNEEKEHNNKEITRNLDDLAIINIYNRNKEIAGAVIVDDDKWYELSKIRWTFKNDKKYVSGCINGKTITIHRYLMNAPEGIPVDHINQNGLDNRIGNLRLITDSANSHNRKKQTNSLSIYKGVYPKKNNKLNPYRAKFNKDGKEYHLGYYNNELKAAYAYNLKAEELFGEFANLNEIDIDDETRTNWKEEIFNKWKI
jgi:hypothetical protein